MGISEHLTCLLRNLYAGQEATVRTGHGTTDWFQIGKGVHQGCILSPCLFNLYAESIMINAGVDEAQAGITIVGRNINNLRYADDTTIMAESKKIQKEISPEYSLEGLMLKLKLLYFGTWWEELTHWKRHWWWKDWRREEKGTTEDEMVGSHHRLNGWVWASSGSLVINGEAWRAILHGVTKCWTWLSYWTELNQLFKIEGDGLDWGHYEKLLDSCKGNSQI